VGAVACGGSENDKSVGRVEEGGHAGGVPVPGVTLGGGGGGRGLGNS
jgi:hypothetical protein